MECNILKSSIPFTKLIIEVLEAFNSKNQTTLKGAHVGLKTKILCRHKISAISDPDKKASVLTKKLHSFVFVHSKVFVHELRGSNTTSGTKYSYVG